MNVDPERSQDSSYEALASDPKIAAVIDTVRRVVGLPTGPSATTFAPAQVERSPRPAPAAPAPERPRPVGARPHAPAATKPVAASMGPEGRRAGRAAPLRSRELTAGPPRGLLFGAFAALLLHLAVFLALASAEPVIHADAGPVGSMIGALIGRVGLPT